MSQRSQNSIFSPHFVWRFLVEARQELKKVSWPSRETTIQYTMIVIIASLVMGVVIGGLDYLLSLGLRQLINIF